MAQKKNFIGGINGDLANEFLPEGVDRYRLNVRVISNSAGEYGVLTTCNGNIQLDYTLPAGNNICIHTREYEPTKKSYAHIYNSLGSHSILEYDYANNVVSCVMQDVNDTYLRFRETHIITGSNIVRLTDESHLYYWTDNYQNPITKEDYNEPKKINIEKGKYYMQGNYTLGYPNVSGEELWEFFHRGKQPPLNEPNVAFSDDLDVTINLLNNKLFQFKAKFVYDDNEESRWSPISIYAQPACLCGNTNPTKNNNILIEVPTGINIVKRIKIAAKEVNNTDFVLIADLDKDLLQIPSNSTYTYKFYNDGIYLPIEINDSIQLYDRVPKRSLAQEIVQGNRIVDGNITEEFDAVPVDMKLDLDFYEDIKQPLWEVKGRIYIPNLRQSLYSYINKYQPIYQSSQTEGQTVWGGLGYNQKAPNPLPNVWVEGIVKNVPDYDQTLPLGGFYVYLVGTEYGAISVQNPTGVGGQFGVNNIYDFGTINLLAPTDAMMEVTDEMQSQNVYSTFSLKAPAGKYIMRITNSKDQTTSILTCGVGGYAIHECLIEIDNNGNITIPTVGTYAQGTEIPDSFVLDLTSAAGYAPLVQINNNWTCVKGYIKDILPDSTSIELAKVELNRLLSGTAAGGNLANTNLMVLTNAWGESFIDDFINRLSASGDFASYYQITDHNGCFFHAVFNDPTNAIKLTVTDVVVGTTSRSSAPTLENANADCETKTLTLTDTNNNSRTKIEGYVYKLGIPISGAIVSTTRGKYAVTDYNGYYRIPIYPDTNVTPQQRNDTLICSLNGGCIGIWNTDDDKQPYSVNPISGAGYNWSNLFTANQFTLQNIIGSSPVNALKRGGNYIVGIVYYDHINRSGLSNINDWNFKNIDSTRNTYGTKLTIPFYTEINPNTNTIYGGSYPLLDYNIFNQAPAWAKWYRFVFAKNSATNNYLDFVINGVQYLNAQGGNTTYSSGDATQVKLNIGNITGSYKTANSDSILVYDFVKNDRIIFIRDENGNLLNNYYNMLVKSFDAGTQEIICEITNSMPELKKGVLYEIYTPKADLPVTQQLTFEIGESNKVVKFGNFYIHEGETQSQKIWNWIGAQNSGGFLRLNGLTGNTLTVGDYVRLEQRTTGQTTNYYNTYATITSIISPTSVLTDLPFTTTITSTGTVSLPAKGSIQGGDTFYKFRNMQADTTPYVSFLEDKMFSDFYESEAWFFGRPNRIDPQIKEITRPNTIYFSLPFVPESQINGLSNVYDNMFQEYYHQFASIQKFVYKNTGLLCYTELKVIRIPIEQNIYQGTAGEQVVGASTQVLSPQTNTQVYQADFGASKHPEAIFSHEQADYFFDINRGALCRLSTDGITPISELYGEKTLFVELARKIKSATTKVKCLGVYDTKYNEYILNVPQFGYIEGEEEKVFEGLCIAFNELKNAFSTFYSFESSEFFGRAATNIFSVKNGSLWLHDVNPIQNNFYGVQNSSLVSQIVNEAPLDVKVLQAVEVESNDEWLIYSLTTENGQETRMGNAANWLQKENQRYAFVKMDINTPNVTNPIINGNPLRDRTFKVDFEYRGTEKAKIFSVNYKYIISNLHNQ